MNNIADSFTPRQKRALERILIRDWIDAIIMDVEMTFNKLYAEALASGEKK